MRPFFSRIIVSIDGPTRAAHDQLRGKIGTFEQAATLVHGLQLSNACPVRINTVVVQPALMKDGARSIAELVSGLRPAEWCLIQPHPANKKNDFDLYSLTSDQFESFVAEVRAIIKRENLPVGRLISRTTSEYSGIGSYIQTICSAVTPMVPRIAQNSA